MGEQNPPRYLGGYQIRAFFNRLPGVCGSAFWASTTAGNPAQDTEGFGCFRLGWRRFDQLDSCLVSKIRELHLLFGVGN